MKYLPLALMKGSVQIYFSVYSELLYLRVGGCDFYQVRKLITEKFSEHTDNETKAGGMWRTGGNFVNNCRSSEVKEAFLVHRGFGV